MLNGGRERMELKKLKKQAHILEKCRRKCVGRQGYEFMTAYDTIVSMGVERMHVPRHSRLHGVRGGGGREWGHQ